MRVSLMRSAGPITASMPKEAKDKHFIHKPVYPGGGKAMGKFIQSHLRYPDSARESNVEGYVQIRYSINHKGNVADTKVISSLSPDCDQEAQRVVRLLKFDVAAQYKARVLFHKTIRVWFRLPPNTEKPKASPQYQYAVKKSSAPTDQKTASAKRESSKKKSYHYTITIS